MKKEQKVYRLFRHSFEHERHLNWTFNKDYHYIVNIEAIEEEQKMLTTEFVKTEIEKNNFETTTFTCPDGTKADVAPCLEWGEKKIENCEYFLIYWDLPWGGESTLEELVKTLNRHEELADERNNSKEKLQKYFEEHQEKGWESEDFDFYSDWHKDVYGFRPHGYVCGEYVQPW